MAWKYSTATELVAALRTGSVASRDLLEYFIARIENFDNDINAVVLRRFEAARAEADAADEKRRVGGALGALHGLPMTVKESFQVAGMPTCWGIQKVAETAASQDAVAIRRLRDAGAIIIGKTNVPTSLADWQTYNSVYGVTNNPWDITRSPGGSSGGAAAALAAGMTPLELGTDIGASIRNPAHYCGVYGHKPTFGIVSQSGHAIPGTVAQPDLGVVGPLAISAEDLDLALSVVAGSDTVENSPWTLQLPPPRRSCLADFRVGIIFDAPEAPVDADVRGKLEALADCLRGVGTQVTVDAWPDIDRVSLRRLYFKMLRAETSRRYSGIEAEKFRAEVGSRFSDTDDYWTIAREATVVSHRDWLMMNELRHRMRQQWAKYFDQYDILVCPVAATAAMPHDHTEPRHERKIIIDGKSAPSIDQMYWAGFATLCYLPATAFPLGLTDNGLPVGAQAIGPEFADRSTIAFAKHVARAFGGFSPPKPQL